MCSIKAINTTRTENCISSLPILTNISKKAELDIKNIVNKSKGVVGKNIILDLDGTLIDSQFKPGAQAALVMGGPLPTHVCGKNLAELRMYKRPGLIEFLNWCFDTFDNVALWSLSGEEWINEFFKYVIPDIPRSKWSFVWTGERATRISSSHVSNDKTQLSDFVYLNGRPVVKDLKKIFRQKSMKEKGIFKHNTIIVEDTPSNCVRQYGNAIYVEAFDVSLGGPDSVLSYLQKYLQKCIIPARNVRSIDKQTWYTDIKEDDLKKQSSDQSSTPKVSFWMRTENFKSRISQGFQKEVLKMSTATYHLGI